MAFDALFMDRDSPTFFRVSRLRTCSRMDSKTGSALMAWSAFLWFVSIIRRAMLRIKAIPAGDVFGANFFEPIGSSLDIIRELCKVIKVGKCFGKEADKYRVALDKFGVSIQRFESLPHLGS